MNFKTIVKRKSTAYICFLAFACVATTGFAQEIPTMAAPIPLWSGDMPVKQRQALDEKVRYGFVGNILAPEIIPFPAGKNISNGAAVVIFPGGSYINLAYAAEGEAIANWFNSLGVSAFVVKYRLRTFGHPAPLMDGLRAIQMVRSKAKEWNIDPHKIGVIGFSAGGHLASSVGTHYQDKEYLYGDLVSVEARPDFMILVYPVITFSDPFAHAGSRRALLGEDPSTELIEYYSNEKHVDVNTPPTFLVHGDNDHGVPMENSMKFYVALRQAQVLAEMHIFQKADHGFLLNEDPGPVSEWTTLCQQWLRLNGFVE